MSQVRGVQPAVGGLSDNATRVSCDGSRVCSGATRLVRLCACGI